LAGTADQPVLASERARQGDQTIAAVEEALSTKAGFGLPPPTFLPRRYKPRNVGEWTGHLTFASELIVALRPSLIVELGTHWGEAYFTFCQTVQEHGLNSLCYAVDHWLGDEHAGHYGEEVFEEVSQYNDRFYRQFSYLLRRSFDDALPQFADNSIGILHIDGLHTYEAVRHDFRNWLPKVRPGGFVLLHDICPRHQDFGVWRLWDDIKSEFRDTFEFHHSWGLGVLRKDGGERKTLLEELLFDSSPAVSEVVRRHYVIYGTHLEHLLGCMPPIPAPRIELPLEIRVEVFTWINGGHSPEVCQVRKMSAGRWNTLVFDLSDTDPGGPLRIDPGCEPSFIEIGDILIHSNETGDLIWKSPASWSNRDFHIGGSAVAHPDDASFLINVGDDPLILLNTPPEVHGPLKLTISLKVTPVHNTAMEIIHGHLQGPFAAAKQKLAAMEQERSALATQLENTEVQLNEALATRDETHDALQNTYQILAQERTRLSQMQNSASWRVTAPLRRLMTALRSGPRNMRQS